MGRVKLKIKRLENNSGRQVTYSKRRSGILKKAREISILCDIDIALLMFSPTGKPTVCLGEKSSMEEVVGKFAQLTAQERAKRKLESLEALKKTFKKLDHDVNIQDFLGSSSQTAEDLSSHSRLLQARLSELHQRLSCWTDAEKITNVEHLKAMEESLQESLSRMRAHKENAQKQQQHAMALACFNQFDEGMNLPMGINVEQEAQQMPWLPCNDPRQPLLPDNLDALSQSMSREIDCTPDSSIPSYSGYFGAEKQSDLNQQEHMVSIREFNPNGCMNLQVGEFSFNPYDPSSLGDKKLLSDPNVGFLDDSMNYRINSYDMPRPGFIDSINEWTSSSAPYPSFPVYNELSYPHIPNQG